MAIAAGRCGKGKQFWLIDMRGAASEIEDHLGARVGHRAAEEYLARFARGDRFLQILDSAAEYMRRAGAADA